jgi:RNA polymerase sigma-70 factor, ECF subfamily
MDRYADGDSSAFGAVYDLLARRLFAFFVRHTRDRAFAEDLTQQTMLHIHRARQGFVRGSDVTPWAFAIGRRLLIDSRRRRRNEVLFDSADEESTEAQRRGSVDALPEAVAYARQLACRAGAEIERLPGPQRAAFELVRYDGLSVAQAAEALGTTTAAVKQRVHRACEALRAVGIGADA